MLSDLLRFDRIMAVSLVCRQVLAHPVVIASVLIRTE